MRISDADREAARQCLVDAYADGRLDAADLEARAAAVLGAVTADDLRAVVADLPDAAAGADLETRTTVGEAVRDTLVFVVCSAVALLVWRLTGRGFFWPLWVLVFTGLPLLAQARRLLVSRH